VISYVFFYTPLKRRTIYSTLIGSIAGATPPVVGYCAVMGVFNIEALILFLILFFWQMPHFYAIAMYRLNDYSAASIPLLPIKKGTKVTKIHIVIYIVAFIITASLLTAFGFTGYIYLSVVLALGFIWLWRGIAGFKPDTNDALWAKDMFIFSLVILIAISIVMAFGKILP